MSQSKSKYTLTPIQLARWVEIRKDTTSEFLPNPKTEHGHPKIKRDGETFKKIEKLYEKREQALKPYEIDESQAALPKDDLERILALTLQHSAYAKDPRTASKIAMINKNLNASYKRLVRASEAKERGILLDPVTTKELIMDSYLNFYYIKERPRNPEHVLSLNEPSDSVVLLMMQQIINRIKYIRSITRRHPTKAYVKPTKPMEKPLTPETIDSVISNFNKKYTAEPTLGRAGRHYIFNDIIRGTLERFTKLYNKDSNTFIVPLTPAQQKLKDNILKYYDVTEPIAIFYTYFTVTYIDNYVYLLLTAIRGTLPPWVSRDIRLIIDESSLSYFYSNYAILTKQQLDSMVNHNQIDLFKRYLNNGLDPNFVYLVDGNIVPMITILRNKNMPSFIEEVTRHPDFVNPEQQGGKKKQIKKKVSK